jgi:alkanesulfonate monooxygenase SsuD/methylene tetrahydromethanopterin reductase-like flavin-dependent oxidoreductase (luciferase family)
VQEAFNYDLPAPQTRTQFWEGIDLIRRAWTEPGPFEHEGRHYPLRYANTWPLPVQRPHPPIWVPGGFSRETVDETARRGLTYFLSSRTHGAGVVSASSGFKLAMERCGQQYHPNRFGILISVYVAETDEQAERESQEAVWYYLRNCLKGHVRTKGRSLTHGIGSPNMSLESQEAYLRATATRKKMLGDAESWSELRELGSVVVGSPERVREHLWEIIENAHVGNLLIQFHMGNMPDELARKNMRLFATEVAPELRKRSARLFAQNYGQGEPLPA